MLDDAGIRAIAQKIVDMSKRSAREETGWLKRSISYTVTRNVYIFREVYYGQFKDNSLLEKNARKLMPNGTVWRIDYTDRKNRVVSTTEKIKGRASQNSILRYTTSAVTNLLNRVRGKKKN